MSPKFVLFGEFLLIGAIHSWLRACIKRNGLEESNTFDSLGRLNDLEIMQFTGLKDQFGKDIFEGDIIEMDGKYHYEVRYESAKFVCYHAKQTNAFNNQKWGDLHRFSDYDFKEYSHYVIGNIYENPELV